MRITDTSDLWFKNAVIYCLDVKRYADSNGDGWGDFQGLSRKVDYLADLGVTCIWLMPFYPSPLRTTATTSPTSTRSTRGWAASATSSTSCGPRTTAASG